MLDPIQIFEALAFSAVAAGAVVLLCGWPWRKPKPARARIGGAAGVGLAIYAGCWWMEVAPHWPPREDHDRLLLILLPATVAVEAIIALAARPRWLPWLLRVALAAGAAPILLYRSTYISDLAGPGSREWTVPQTMLIFGVLATLLAVVWSAMWLLLKRSACRSVPVVLALVCAGASVTVMLSGYANGGQTGLTIAAGLAGAVVASLALAGTPQMNGVLGVGLVGLFSLLVVGRFFGQLSTPNAALLFCAPLLAWGAELRFIRRGGSIAHGIVRVILPAIPVAIALLLAQRQFVADSSRTTNGTAEPSADDYMNFGK